MNKIVRQRRVMESEAIQKNKNRLKVLKFLTAIMLMIFELGVMTSFGQNVVPSDTIGIESEDILDDISGLPILDPATYVAPEPVFREKMRALRSDAATTSLTIPITHYKQCNYSGNICSGTTICNSGCALTSVSIVLSAKGIAADPSTLNTWLQKNSGYSDCAIRWGVAASYNNSGITCSFSNGSYSDYLYIFKSEIDAGRPVIVQVKGSSGPCGHYVVLYGYNNNGETLNDFIVSDPGKAAVNAGSFDNTYRTCTNARIVVFQNFSGQIAPAGKPDISWTTSSGVDYVFSDNLTVSWKPVSGAISYQLIIKQLLGEPNPGWDEPGLGMKNNSSNYYVINYTFGSSTTSTTLTPSTYSELNQLTVGKWLKIYVQANFSNGTSTSDYKYFLIKPKQPNLINAPSFVTPGQTLSLSWVNTSQPEVKYSCWLKELTNGLPDDATDTENEPGNAIDNKQNQIPAYWNNIPLPASIVAGRYLKIFIQASNPDGYGANSATYYIPINKVTVNTDKSTYTKGETIAVSGSAVGVNYSYTNFYLKTTNVEGTSPIPGFSATNLTSATPQTTFSTSSLSPGTYYVYIVSYFSSGTIEVKDFKQITVTDAAFLTISPTSYNFPASGGTSSAITVTSNQSWTVSSNASWLTVSPANGSNNGTFTMRATVNSSPYSRSATVTVTGGGIPPKTISVTQDAGADVYEPNDTQSSAYNLGVNFSGNSATINTTGSNFHTSNDVDYYKIDLPSGYNYTVTPRLQDSYSSDNGQTYTVDAKFSYLLNSGSWSIAYDTNCSAISVTNGGTLYFKVEPYYSGNMGTYLLTINITRAIQAPAPANDQCSNATNLSCGTSIQGTMAGATPTTSVSYPQGATQNDVFYKFTATNAGTYTITLTKSNSSDDIDLGLYSSCNATNVLAQLTNNNITETMTYSCTAGTTYLIRATDWKTSGSSGSFTIKVDCPQTYTVTLDMQGGTGVSPSVTATYGAAMPSATAPTRTYTLTYNYNGNGQSNTTVNVTYPFGGYYTETNGSGTQYYTSSMGSARNWDIASNTTLYAKWTSASTTLPAPTRTGYTFAGWYTASSGGTYVGGGGGTYTPTAAITLYAQWTTNPVINTSSNPAVGGTTSGGGTYAYGASCTVTATANSGYTFTNWTENGTFVSNSESYQFTVSVDRNLVANFTLQNQWQIGDPTPANVIASFNNGILTITGTGAMQNFDPATRPWVDVKDNITSIVINNGVTTIGNGAFEDLSNLTSVTIPNSMIKIGEHAFLVCPKLISLPNGIGNSVQEIQYGAFDKCSSLTSINIPGSVNTIAQWAFAFMDALNSVTVNWATPFMLTDGSVFSSIDLSKVTLNVPSGTACAYAAADYWKDFNIVGASFTVTPSAGSGGSISPNTVQTLACGSNITFTATPNSGKQVDQWLLNGSVVQTGGTTYTTSNIQANATLQVTFKDTPPVYFTITATAGSGGVISPSGSVPVSSGANQTFTFTPNTNYDIDQVMVDGVVNSTAKANGYYAFSNVTAPHTISVTFKQIQQYTVSTSSNPVAGGTTSGDGAYFSGTSCTVSALANTGYVFESWTENGAVVSTNPSYTFTVSNDRSLVANFTKIKSNDATLGSLTVSSGTLNPVFNADTTNYTVEVTNDVSSITIDAIANSSAATISGTGTKSINVGSNTVTVTVTAEDGTTKIYTIVINRPNITAINEVKNTNLNIYPNPTKNELFIKTDLQIKKVEISDLTGHNVKILNATSVQNGIQTISVSSLLKGIYLVKVYTDNSVVISKIVKE